MMSLTRVRFCSLVALGLASLAGGMALAQGDTRTERIQFKKGESSAAVTGHIKGYQSVDYLVGARKGQTANISLATKHTATYFNILAPGKTDEAFEHVCSHDVQGGAIAGARVAGGLRGTAAP
jgi:hypothetical protein